MTATGTVGRDRWFRVTPVGDGVTLVEEPYGGDLLASNIWHVRGRDRDLVVDSGLGVVALRDTQPWLFENDPVLVLTHAHLDHMGGAHEFADCRVHAAEVGEVRRPGPASLRTARLLELLGLPADLVTPQPAVALTALPDDDAFDLDAYALRGVPAAAPLEEGDVVDLGDRTLTVLSLPGHTPGSLALLDGSGALLTGDVLYEGGLIDSCTGSDVVAYRSTMERLLDLDVTRMLPGHGRVLPPADGREIAAAYLASTRP
ncbi:MBL fold metallo-hydrolase [Kineosporia sp. R_H_3]|uniref:MBL fold metallo-hydrolase n=1 Tax=Kineosporia sp. R_H_3 TaxID=1961848 RepID=UPI000B4A8D60|nr:MBL fold metallo-hydrolase [Kineosporia sp. R_H_3]